MTIAAAPGSAPAGEAAPSMRTVVLASSAGTAFEWYDFFVYGALAPVIAVNFFSELEPTAGLIAAMALFAAGFLFRPVGALIFGWLGDRYGRKGAFLATVILMGAATFAIGLLPNYAQAGPVAVVLLVMLRILQGLAVGGEYGGAAIYVAEHAAPQRRGLSTAWIQSSAAFGLLGAQGVVLLTRLQMGEEAFGEWGWRIPFLVSAGLLAVSIWMRLKLKESPEFERAKVEGRLSQAPFADVFLKWKNLKIVLIALVSIMGAQGAVWWCTFFYTQIFLESSVKLPAVFANLVLIVATIVSIPLYIFFGWLSDKIGRKPVLIFGMALALVAVFPSFHAIARGANPALFAATKASPVEVHADPASCSFQFDLLGRVKYVSGCDIARNMLTRAGAAFATVDVSPGEATVVRVGAASVTVADGTGLDSTRLSALTAKTRADIQAALVAAGYPASANDARIDWTSIAFGLLALVVAATAIYGPQAAALVELFPTNVRYTALSVPYHIGVGWVGGFMPVTAFAIATAAGDIFAGLWYLVFFTVISVICCLFLFPETRGRALGHADAVPAAS
ncbi:MAG: MFS transporter [Alphaproteobacteria bacterium]|nr:MFS transporter [Alphaproteobacteria bacterium]